MKRSEGRIIRRLQHNRDLMLAVMRASVEDWNRIRNFIKSLSGTQKTEANRLLRGMKSLPEGGSLERLVFSSVLALWKGKSSAYRGTGTGGGGTDRVAVERIVVKHLMNGEDGPLSDISEEICQIVQVTLEDEDASEQQTVQQATSPDTQALVDVDRSLLQLVRSRSTESEWGGTIDVASDKPGALTEVAAFKAWTPFVVAPIRKTLQSFVDENLAPKSVIENLDNLIALRGKLVSVVGELAVSPIALLAGDQELFATVESYLKAYELCLRQLHGCYHDMHGAADTEAESVISQLLALETYVFRRDGQFDALMSPLHPLYLWRNATLVREVRGLAATLALHEAETLAQASTENAQFLQVLLLPPAATGLTQPTMLGHAGFIGRLPLFREAPRGLLETDGIESIADMTRRIAQLRPFIRSGLQVMFINLPHPKRFVAAILDNLELENTLADDTFWGIHLRIRYTHPDTRGWAAEFDDLEDTLRDAISAGEERGLVTISIQPEIIPWDTLDAELKANPAHLAVVMDPFEVRSTQVARAAHFNLSPWNPGLRISLQPYQKRNSGYPSCRGARLWQLSGGRGSHSYRAAEANADPSAASAEDEGRTRRHRR